ncbi:MAG: leucyl aminopeptidase [Bacteroidales bacterium]|nr:leucyl aminopeptidase [Bacteroidales bacterium]MCF8405381.1 leucyl aminopeptidase [Bacteroidales bacterium]
MLIYKTTSLGKNDSLILIGLKNSDFSAYLKTDDEIKYLKKQVKNDKKHIVINQLNRFVYINIVDSKILKDKDKLHETLRRDASKYKTGFNDNNITEIKILEIDGEASWLLAFAEGLALANYQFLKYFKDKEEKENKLGLIAIYSNKINKKEVEDLNYLIQGVYLSRSLVNEPLSYLTAVKLSEEISEMGKEAGFTVEVFHKKKIESLKMGGLLAVNKGSVDPPTFNILEYKPKNAVNKKPYVLVGKGIVFDTGGLSLKPTADSMDYMKSDMAGAAAVAGTFYSIAKAELPVHVIGLIPSTDNRPDGNAYAPGDVITMFDGTTVEVLNTDAEGRMILADALSWAKKYHPELVIDLATLTGAAWVAIGTEGMVGMGNAKRKVMDSLQKSGYATHERIAEFPFWEEYAGQLKSDIADLKNIGGKLAGAITAGKFLEHFTDYPYIHLDIAGPSYSKTKETYKPKGGSGVGVRLLFNFFQNLSK